MAVLVGCGSWADAEYIGLLYPPKLPAGDRLRAYAHWFSRVELNSTYHATPPRANVARWVEQTPESFRFDWKLPRAFSQSPGAAAKGDLTDKLLAAAEPILEANRFGTFLLTLAPSFGPSRHRLDELDELIEKLRPHRLAVELRHSGWVEGHALEETLAFFRERKLVWVALDLPRIAATAILPAIDEVTCPDLAYMRLHGRNPNYLRAKTAEERHHYEYTAEDLAEIAGRVKRLSTRVHSVHVSVNNHAADFAPRAALDLRRLLGQLVPDRLPGPNGAQANFAFERPGPAGQPS